VSIVGQRKKDDVHDQVEAGMTGTSDRVAQGSRRTGQAHCCLQPSVGRA
jgi:hypothetical protein